MRRKTLQTLLVLALVALAALLRRPDAFFQPQFFVEDGAVFFKQDYERGASAIWTTYAGYLHLIPRLIAFFASAFPLELRPRVYTHSCLAVLWAITAWTMRERIALPYRPAFALAPMLIPIGPFIYLHLTNIQWFTAIVLLLSLVQRPATSYRQAAFDTLTCLLVGLTGPFSIVALALSPMRLWIHGFRKLDLPFYLSLAVCAMVQATLLLTASSSKGGSFHHVTAKFLGLQGARYLMGDGVANLMTPFQLSGVALLLVACLAFIVLASQDMKKLATFFFASASLVFVVGLYRSSGEVPKVNAFHSGIRYMFLPHLCVTYILLLGLSSGRLGRWLSAPLLLLASVASATTFTMPTPEDLHFERYCDDIRAGKPVTVPLLHEGWSMTLNSARTKPSPH